MTNAMASSLIFGDDKSFVVDLAVLFCVSFVFFVWLLKPPQRDDEDDDDDESDSEAIQAALRRDRRERKQQRRAAVKHRRNPEWSESDCPPAAPTGARAGREGGPRGAEAAARGRAGGAGQGERQQQSAAHAAARKRSAPSLAGPEQRERQASAEQELAGAAVPRLRAAALRPSSRGEQTRGGDLMGSSGGGGRTLTGTHHQRPTTNQSKPVSSRPARVMDSREVEKAHSSDIRFYTNIVLARQSGTDSQSTVHAII